jgi:hypothetical protein
MDHRVPWFSGVASTCWNHFIENSLFSCLSSISSRPGNNPRNVSHQQAEEGEIVPGPGVQGAGGLLSNQASLVRTARNYAP